MNVLGRKEMYRRSAVSETLDYNRQAVNRYSLLSQGAEIVETLKRAERTFKERDVHVIDQRPSQW